MAGLGRAAGGLPRRGRRARAVHRPRTRRRADPGRAGAADARRPGAAPRPGLRGHRRQRHPAPHLRRPHRGRPSRPGVRAFAGRGATLPTAGLPAPGAMLGPPASWPVRRPVGSGRSTRSSTRCPTATAPSTRTRRTVSGSPTAPCGARTGRTRGSGATGSSPSAATRCSPRRTGRPAGRPHPSRSSPRRPARRACGGRPRPGPAGCCGAVATCCRTCCASPPTSRATAPGAPAPGWTCARRPRSPRRSRPCRRPPGAVAWSGRQHAVGSPAAPDPLRRSGPARGTPHRGERDRGGARGRGGGCRHGRGARGRRRTGTNLTGVPGGACAAAGRSAARTTAITG